MEDLEFDLKSTDRTKPAFDSLISSSQLAEREITRATNAIQQNEKATAAAERTAQQYAATLSKTGQGGGGANAYAALGLPTPGSMGGGFAFDPSNRRFRNDAGGFASVNDVLSSNPGKDSLEEWIASMTSSLEDTSLSPSERTTSKRDLAKLKQALKTLNADVGGLAADLLSSVQDANDSGKSRGGGASAPRGGLPGNAPGGGDGPQSMVASMLLSQVPGGDVISSLMGSGILNGQAAATIGLTAAAIGGVAIAVKYVSDSLAEVEDRRRQVELLGTTFLDVKGTIDEVQTSIQGVASGDEIASILAQVSGKSPLADSAITGDFAAVIKEQAYRLGTTWQELMTQSIQAVSSGNGQALEQSKLITDANSALLAYADSIGKTVPQLTAYERQQALVNAVIREGQKVLDSPDSSIEQLLDTNKQLSSSWKDLKAAFAEYTVSLVDPAATSALGWWTQQLNNLTGGIKKVQEQMSDATTDRRVRAVLPDDQLAAYDALNSKTDKATADLYRAINARYGSFAVPAEELAKTDTVVRKLLDDLNLLKEQRSGVQQRALQGENILNDPVVAEAARAKRAAELQAEIDTVSARITAERQNLAEARPTGTMGREEFARQEKELQDDIVKMKSLVEERNALLVQMAGTQKPADYTGTTVVESASAKLDADISAMSEKIEKGKALLPQYQSLQNDLAGLQERKRTARQKVDDPAQIDDEAARNNSVVVLKQSLEAEKNFLIAEIEKTNNAIGQAANASNPTDALRQSFAQTRSSLAAEISRTQEAVNAASRTGDTVAYDAGIAKLDELQRAVATVDAKLAELPESAASVQFDESIAKLDELYTKLTNVNTQMSSLPDVTKTTSMEVLDNAFTQLTTIDRQIRETEARIAALMQNGAVDQASIRQMTNDLAKMQEARSKIVSPQGAPTVSAPTAAPAQGAQQEWLPLGDFAEKTDAATQSLDKINARFGQTTQAVNAANEALRGMGMDSTAQFMDRLAQATEQVTLADQNLVAARATGNKELEALAQRNGLAVASHQRYLESVEAVAVATGKLAEAKANGSQADIAAATNQLTLAQSFSVSARAADLTLRANTDGATALKLYTDSQNKLIEAQRSGSVEAIKQAEANAQVARSLLNASQAAGQYEPPAATPIGELAVGDVDQRALQAAQALSVYNAQLGNTPQAINAANDAIMRMNVQSPADLMGRLVEATNQAAVADRTLADAKATGNKELETQAQQNAQAASANLQYLQSVEAVSLATGKLAEAKANGSQADIAAASNQLRTATATREAAATAVTAANANNNASSAIRLYVAAQQELDKAYQDGSQSAIQQAEANLKVAASLLAATTTAGQYKPPEAPQADNLQLDTVTKNAEFAARGLAQYNAQLGNTPQAATAANDALLRMNVQSPVDLMNQLATATQQVTIADQNMTAAKASGNKEFEVQAQRNAQAATAHLAYVQSVEAVAVATGRLADAKATGTQADIAAATNQLVAASAAREAAQSADLSAQAYMGSSDAVKSYFGALDELATAQASGSQSAIQQAQANLNLAASLVAASSGVTNYNAANSSTVQVAGILLDKVTGLPVAFDAMSYAMSNGATNATALNAAMAVLQTNLQNIENNAANAAFSISQRLVPAMGVAGSLKWATERASEVRDLREQFDAGNAQRVADGQSPLGEQVFQSAAGALQQNWGAQADQALEKFNKMGDATRRQADIIEQATARMNSALDGMIQGVLQDSTKGLINVDEILPREDTVDEDARRMADVAVKGFKSPWFAGLKNLFPEEVLSEGESAVKMHAARMVKDHQEGLTAVFYNTNRAADIVIEKLRGAQEMKDKVAEIREEVKAKGIEANDLDIMKALGIDVTQMQKDAEKASSASTQKSLTTAATSFEAISKQMADLFKTDGNPLIEMTKLTDEDKDKLKAPAQGAMSVIGEEMVNQAAAGNYGQRVVMQVIAQFDAKKEEAQQSGKSFADWWAGSAIDRIDETFPPAVLDIVVKKLGPLMAQSDTKNSEAVAGGGK